MPKPLGISKDRQSYLKQYYLEHKHKRDEMTSEYKIFRYAKNKYNVTDDECKLFGEEHIKEYGRAINIIKELCNISDDFKKYIQENV